MFALAAFVAFGILAVKTGFVLACWLYVGLALLALALSPIGGWVESRWHRP
jgi:hypothetical protein